MLLISMLLFFYTDSLFAQQPTPSRSHPINIRSSIQAHVPDTLTLIAVRVEFQRDNNRLTTGDGTFNPANLSYLDKPEIRIDPLPHNRTYFESHLEFAKNYFEKVSGEQMTVRYQVLPDIYQLPQKMESYSPVGETFTNEKVANLIKDTWELVEQQGGFSTSGLDPEKTAFIIFHAGVGRDIELTGTTLDKTPQDIPSLYLDQSSLSRLLDDPYFDGFDINDGGFQITNTAVLPQTLSRRGEDFSGQEFAFQLALNGLLCASIGSYLGLPDLFDTQTGNAGIGRFGLMDGESFFSYRGLFPPEPSAWEKLFLGWQTPFTISPNTSGAISLPAATFHQNNSIAKNALSGSEYFLIENRHRDPAGNGVTLTFRQPDGTVQTKTFTNRDEAFVNQTEEFTEQLISGVVTDVSNFDWSLPGGLDPGPDETANTSDDRLLNGGILIWHIDEAVIGNRISSQTVNADPDRRGVDLEEADGAQDIGRVTSPDFSRQARGTAFDFWWKGNNAAVITADGDTLRFYENRFGPDTRPSNKSNSGAAGFFELYDFSPNQPVASFRIRPRSTEEIKALSLPADSLPDQRTFTDQDAEYFSSFPLGLSLFKTQTDSFLIIPSQHSTYALNLSGGENPVFDFQSGAPQQPYRGRSLILGQAPLESQVEVTSWQWNGTDWNLSWQTETQANQAFLSSSNDQTLLLDFTDQRLDIESGTLQAPLANPQQQSATQNGQLTVLTPNTLALQPDGQSYSVPSADRQYTGVLPLTKDKSAFYFLSDTDLLIFDPENFTHPRTVVQNTPLEWPALTDINGDGRIDFIYVNNETGAAEARNLNGAMLSHFPIRPPQGSAFIGTPLIATFQQTDEPIIYISTQDSLSINIRAYSVEGKMAEGFPLYVGSISAPKNQPVHPIISGKTLYAVSHRGELKAWQFENMGEILWGTRYGNTRYNKISGVLNTRRSATPSASERILVERETYNWPNPAEDFTNLRFQTRSAGVVDVKIITPGGKVIFDERYQANGSVPEEHRISTERWSNGLYFAMITATVNGGKARKMLKIVVVH